MFDKIKKLFVSNETVEVKTIGYTEQNLSVFNASVLDITGIGKNRLIKFKYGEDTYFLAGAYKLKKVCREFNKIKVHETVKFTATLLISNLKEDSYFKKDPDKKFYTGNIVSVEKY